MSRNSDAYSLLILDEHLWKWIDACNYNDSLLSSPDRDDCRILLKRTLSAWPVLLKLLGSIQAGQRPPVWLPYVIRASDRIFLVARDIPMKSIRGHVDELVQKISEIETRANELVEMQVEKEKLIFISTYSNVSSDHHSAIDYWPIWEPHVRGEALSVIKSKLEEFQCLLTDRRKDLERMHLEQLAIRDRWAEMRNRLNPERYEDSSTWWGSMVRPVKDTLKSDFLNGIPELLSLPDSKLARIASAHVMNTSRGLSRIHLNTTSAMSVSGKDGAPEIPWTILRSTCLDLLKELAIVVERKVVFSPVVAASVNIIDILLRLLYCRDMTQFEEEEQSLSQKILQARKDTEIFDQNIHGVNPSFDAVVARFTADEKAECVEAAIRKVMASSTSKNTSERDDRMRTLIELQAKLKTLQAYRTNNFELPWDATWVAWKRIVGEDAKLDGPPPLCYVSEPPSN